MTIRLAHASILTALKPSAIGTRVVNPNTFLAGLDKAIAKHVPSADQRTGQHYVELPTELNHTVRGGVGTRTESPQDYIVRLHRGQVGLYLNRDLALPVEALAAMVYTVDAYITDPEVTPAERRRITESDATHVLVAVLASAGPMPPLTPERFVSNLAGGNNAVLDWTHNEVLSKAREVKTYWEKHCVVADRAGPSGRQGL